MQNIFNETRVWNLVDLILDLNVDDDIDNDNCNDIDLIINVNLVLSFYCNNEINDTESYDTRQITSLQVSS
jgi:hypothetical protein